MEKGLRRMLAERRLTVGSLVHKQINREDYSDIKYYYDVWHVGKGKLCTNINVTTDMGTNYYNRIPQETYFIVEQRSAVHDITLLSPLYQTSLESFHSVLHTLRTFLIKEWNAGTYTIMSFYKCL